MLKKFEIYVRHGVLKYPRIPENYKSSYVIIINILLWGLLFKRLF